MTDYLLPTLAKILLPAIGIGLIAFVVKKKKLSFAEDIGLRAPVATAALIFLILWVALVTLEEVIAPSAPKSWKNYPIGIITLRIIAIGILGPIAEELAFRGLLLSILRRTRIGIYGAILLSAALWALTHTQYEVAILTLLVVDGVVLGLARHFTGSIYVPIAMHIAGNLFSISQSLRSAA